MPAAPRVPAWHYLFFLGFLVSFLGLLSLATENLPYADDYNRYPEKGPLNSQREPRRPGGVG